MSKKDLALQQALDQITSAHGKGSIMWLGRSDTPKHVPVVSTGSFALDIALGVGGLPKVSSDYEQSFFLLVVQELLRCFFSPIFWIYFCITITYFLLATLRDFCYTFLSDLLTVLPSVISRC